MKDYTVCSTAEVEIEGKRLLFVGAFNQWYLVNVQ